MPDGALARREELFWTLADALLAQPAVTRSTMMGYRAYG
jgi:hypothetical protein